MNVLLIDPPFYRIMGFFNRYFPFGLVALATFLKQNGLLDVKVYDADFNEKPEDIDYSQLPKKYQHYLNSFNDISHPVWQEVEREIKKLNPDVIGIGIWTTFAASAYFIAKIVKKVNPECAVIMGGPHATVKADEILRICPDVDYVIRGEGEYALLDLLIAIDKGVLDAASIDGLSFRKDRSIIHNTLRGFTVDLNKYPFPDRTLLINIDKYSSEDMGLVMSSRGCPYSCTFCATNRNQVSFRSPDHIISEIRFVKEHYKTTQFTFKDDSFTVNRKRIFELCKKLIDEKLPIKWECNTRVNLLDEQMLRIMKKAGCNFIKVGIESGSERILSDMNKGITHDQIRIAAKLFRKVGIHWTGYFMIGVPDETEWDIRRAIDFLYEIEPDFAVIGIYDLFPGTVMWEDGILRGIVNPNMDLEDFYTNLPNFYYKKDFNHQNDKISPEKFAKLESEVKEIVRNYNRNFFRVFKMARAKLPVYWYDSKVLWDDVKKYLSY